MVLSNWQRECSTSIGHVGAKQIMFTVLLPFLDSLLVPRIPPPIKNQKMSLYGLKCRPLFFPLIFSPLASVPL